MRKNFVFVTIAIQTACLLNAQQPQHPAQTVQLSLPQGIGNYYNYNEFPSVNNTPPTFHFYPYQIVDAKVGAAETNAKQYADQAVSAAKAELISKVQAAANPLAQVQFEQLVLQVKTALAEEYDKKIALLQKRVVELEQQVKAKDAQNGPH